MTRTAWYHFVYPATMHGAGRQSRLVFVKDRFPFELQEARSVAPAFEVITGADTDVLMDIDGRLCRRAFDPTRPGRRAMPADEAIETLSAWHWPVDPAPVGAPARNPAHQPFAIADFEALPEFRRWSEDREEKRREALVEARTYVASAAIHDGWFWVPCGDPEWVVRFTRLTAHGREPVVEVFPRIPMGIQAGLGETAFPGDRKAEAEEFAETLAARLNAGDFGPLRHAAAVQILPGEIACHRTARSDRTRWEAEDLVAQLSTSLSMAYWNAVPLRVMEAYVEARKALHEGNPGGAAAAVVHAAEALVAERFGSRTVQAGVDAFLFDCAAMLHRNGTWAARRREDDDDIRALAGGI